MGHLLEHLPHVQGVLDSVLSTALWWSTHRVPVLRRWVRRTEVHGYPWLYSKCQASLSYMKHSR